MIFWRSTAGCMEASPSCLEFHGVGRCGVSVVGRGAHPSNLDKGMPRGSTLLPAAQRLAKGEAQDSISITRIFLPDTLFNWCRAKRPEVAVQAAFFGQIFSL